MDEIKNVELKKIEVELLQSREKINALQIVSHDEYLMASEETLELKRREKKIQEVFKPLKDAARAALQAITDQESKLLMLPREIMRNCDDKIRFYLTQKRQAEQREAEERARKAKEAAEKAKAEARAKWEAEQAEKKAQAEAEKAEKLRVAQELEEQGFSEDAQAIREEFEPKNAEVIPLVAEPVFVAPMPVVVAAPISEEPKAKGISVRAKYKARVVDFNAFVQAIAKAGPDSICNVNLLKVDESALNKLASSLKDQLRIPGVEIYTEETLVKRTAS